MSIIPFRFIHCADLHLDSPFEGVHSVSPAIAEVLREATFRSFDNIIELAIRMKVDFIIIAGDVYDSADRSLRAQWRFHELLRKASKSNIQCFVAHGNHDPLSGWEPGLKLPDNVHRFVGNDIEQVYAKRGNEIIACIYGTSYPSRDIRDNLATRFPKREDSPFAISVLHCNVGGSKDHDNYAPCTIDDLLKSDMDYWALGHIHIQQILNSDKPYVIYSGNTQGRSIRETGEKGCYVVKVDENGYVDAEFNATDVVRWFVENVDISDISDLDNLMYALLDIKERIRSRADGRSAMVRINIGGRGDLHRSLTSQQSDILSSLNDGEEYRKQFVWVESLQINTRPKLDIPSLRQRDNFIGEFLRVSEALKANIRQEMINVLTEPSEHTRIAEQLNQLSDEELLSILEDAEITGLESLMEGEE